MKFTKNYLEQIEKLKDRLETAEAIVIGAGAGMSVSAGLTYHGERFEQHFSDFRRAYGFHDMYSGGFYPYSSLEEYWAYWSRHIYFNRYDIPAGIPYLNLLELVKKKNYFVITTNVDHQFQLAGFDKQRLFYTQGDYGLWQCSTPCHEKTYPNEQEVRAMLAAQANLRIPCRLIPYCPICGKPMTMNLRIDSSFVQDEGWHRAQNRYKEFIGKYQNSKILFLELGVGTNTPVIIKYPFWQMTAGNPKAVYACINKGEAHCPKGIEKQAVCLNNDIGMVIKQLCIFYHKTNPHFKR